MTRTLTLKELNRATLARQLLLERHAMPIPEAVEAIVGLQSQMANPPYIGLWTRLKNFQRSDLTELIEARQIVRAAMMRSTLHLVTADDHQRMRAILQPALERALRSFFGKRAAPLDIDTLVVAAKPFLEEEPRSMGDIRAFLQTIISDADESAMSYLIRTHLPLIQIPPSGTWGVGTRATYMTAQAVLGEPQSETLKYMFKRYLAAFGPASIMDFQTWTGLTNLSKEISNVQDEFILYKDENGKTLFDDAGMPLPDSDAPAPIRFMPEYDNLLISHKDRTRVIADAYRKSVFLSAGRIASTVLIDGFVEGTWKAERNKDTATLRVTLFNPISASVQEAVLQEGEALIRFIEDDAEAYRVEFVE